MKHARAMVAVGGLYVAIGLSMVAYAPVLFVLLPRAPKGPPTGRFDHGC